MKRRNVLKMGAAGTGAGLFMPRTSNADLLFPDGFIPSIAAKPSPPVIPFKDPLFEMPVAQTIDPSTLIPGPDPLSHQRYDEFLPKKFYIERLHEFPWVYHSEPPYDQGSWSWGFTGGGFKDIIPGPTYDAYYGEPIFVRRFNDLPTVGSAEANVRFALPSLTMHLHNAHTASESDGIPQDFYNPGEFWDHHYANFPAGFDEREIMGTLWYHDHRLDFTGPNVYAGLTGMYRLFDEKDSNNERDRNRSAFRLPSGKYDVPLILHDVQFDEFGQVIWDFFNPEPTPPDKDHPHYRAEPLYTVNGMLGDRFTVNRRIQPHFQVEARKYRFRVLNGGPSRFYELFLRAENNKEVDFFVISNDGNLLSEPLRRKSIRLGVAQRHDIIVDFSRFRPGQHVYMVNRMEMRDDGAGPTGRQLDEGDQVMRFDIIRRNDRDRSRIPDFMRELPDINMDEVRRERLFVFDYDNGLWTINGKLMDPNRVDAAIETGTAEIWTWRNTGNAWSHPIHTHFEEFQILEVNGKPVPKNSVLNSRKDVIRLGPNDEIKFYGRWRDFLGKHVMHCHNVVHEDHAMMIRWDMVPPGEGD
jgi:FtsP/CotA-like multicopper oxidase with cupredoxin domain